MGREADTWEGVTTNRAPTLRAKEEEAVDEQAKVPNEPHPWAAFLQARMRCLAWLRDEMKESPEQSVVTMKMDPAQVRMLLQTYDESARKAK
jgi:hypothetical protein